MSMISNKQEGTLIFSATKIYANIKITILLSFFIYFSMTVLNGRFSISMRAVSLWTT